MRTSNELRRAFMLEAEREDIEKRAEAMRKRREEARRRIEEQRARARDAASSGTPDLEPQGQLGDPFGTQPPEADDPADDDAPDPWAAAAREVGDDAMAEQGAEEER